MASAFSNNTERLNSSDRTSNFKAKTNYNYLRLVSLKNVDCKNKRFSSSSGNLETTSTLNLSKIIEISLLILLILFELIDLIISFKY